MVHVADHHLGGPTCCASGFDGTRCAITDLEERHETGGFATAPEALLGAAKHGEVCARAGAVLEETCLTNPEIHDPAVVYQIILHRLDETSVRLRMLIGGLGFGQFAGLKVHIVMAL